MKDILYDILKMSGSYSAPASDGVGESEGRKWFSDPRPTLMNLNDPT